MINSASREPPTPKKVPAFQIACSTIARINPPTGRKNFVGPRLVIDRAIPIPVIAVATG
jgi:hypothetical protein